MPITTKEIEIPRRDLSVKVSPTMSRSTSPSAHFQSPTSSFPMSFGSRAAASVAVKQLKPFATADIKILLLENVNETGREILAKQGYQVQFLKTSLPEDELIEKIRQDFLSSNPREYHLLIFLGMTSDVHVIGIRSKTKLTARVLKEARNLIAIGCFCIGTNQVDLQYAAEHGMVVFNSPFSNSRSVAELVLAEVISLARQLGDRSMEMHKGTWNKVSSKCWEIRGKTLGKFALPVLR